MFLLKRKEENTFAYSGEDFLLNEAPFRIFSGEMHYFRVPKAYWRHRLQCAKAMGLNTISTYMPWNLHEPKPGEFNFTDNLDIEEFLKLAGQEGLKVILRPGPYICAEWELGGLPSWLLHQPQVRVRCLEPIYMKAVRRYLKKVGKICAKYLIQRGGPIILVQVENEYGAFGNDRSYMDQMVELVKHVGFTGQLYTCDWAKPANLKAGEVTGAVTVANFGTKAQEQLTILKALRPKQPVMCGEFWAGWFDAWGEERKGSNEPAPILNELKWMLENNASFNFYMFHGGTSFGLMAGANHYESYTPTVSSYDYWAPLDEAGRPTKKYFAIRDLLSQYQNTLPPVPEAVQKIIEIPTLRCTESASLFDDLPEPVKAAQPQSFEALGQDYGLILYRTEITGLGDQSLEVVEPHDFAYVWVNGKKAGQLDRRLHQSRLNLKDVSDKKAILDILIDTMGRTNFGPKLMDSKGISQRVVYGELTLMQWEQYQFPLNRENLSNLKWTDKKTEGPAFYRVIFHLDAVGDTFLDLRKCRKGVVWINGICLSRFWSIGPQQTAYLPGAWLKTGENELIILDLELMDFPEIQGLKEPILNELH